MTEFDKLLLHLFVAGEIELVLREGNVLEVRMPLQILLVILYFSQYMDMKDLRDQYDILMKKVERQELSWSNDLADRLERALERKLHLTEQYMCRNVLSGQSKNAVSRSDKPKEEFVYCMPFNKGVCTERNTHRGRFAGREGVVLNHTCHRCLQEQGMRVGHAEIDDRCPCKKDVPLS